MAIVVTGGAGFIGSQLSELLVEQGYRVLALDNFDDYYSPSVKRRNLRALLGREPFRLVEGDIRSRADLEKVGAASVEPIDAVVHLAARPGVRASIEHPTVAAEMNIRGLIEVLEFARRHGVPKLLFASSSSVYGERGGATFAEEDPTDAPISPYAATKKAGELICHSYHHLYPISITCLRFFTVYGPRQRPEMAIHNFTRRIDQGVEIPLYGNGEAMRDFTFVADTVAGIERALERCAGFHVYNLGTGRAVTVRETIEALARNLGKEPRIRVLDSHPGDVSSTLANIARAERELGYRARTPFEAGIRRFVEWYLEEKRATVGAASSPADDAGQE